MSFTVTESSQYGVAFGHLPRCPGRGEACLALSWALTVAEGSEAGSRGQKLPPRLRWCQEDQAEVNVQ